jgi:hypothetical protein
MISADTDFVSEFGWAIALPPNWSRREGTGSDLVLSPSYPVTFISDDIAPNSLTWMVLGGEVDAEATAEFEMTTMLPRPVDTRAAAALTQKFFSLMGSITNAEAVRLPDGTRALELTESFTDESAAPDRAAYHLIVPLFSGGPGDPPAYQRLCYYSDADQFARTFNVIRAVCRSFQYRRPFQAHTTSFDFKPSKT